MLTISNKEVMQSREFDELNLLEEWFKFEWGDIHDPVDEIIEYEEDYELQSINQLELLSKEV